MERSHEKLIETHKKLIELTDGHKELIEWLEAISGLPVSQYLSQEGIDLLRAARKRAAEDRANAVVAYLVSNGMSEEEARSIIR